MLSGELATLLQEATVSIINHKTCNKMYDDAVTPRMICAGNIQGGVDACQVSFCCFGVCGTVLKLILVLWYVLWNYSMLTH